jgi:hypothetical protein
MTVRRVLVCLLATVPLLLFAAHPALAQQDNAAEAECIKGTVVKVADGVLHLKNTSFPDETVGKRDATVLLDKATAYYDGPRKVNKAALQPGHLVLVRCRTAGKDRAAVLVRIIGGKKQ